MTDTHPPLHEIHQRLLNDQPVSDQEVEAFLDAVEAGRDMKTFALPESLGSGELRAVQLDGDPWFVAADIAKVLGYSHTPNMVRMLDDDEKDVHLVNTLGGPQLMTIVNVSGLFCLILSSERATAKPFRIWVTHEVLPSIARTGSYSDTDNKMGETLAQATDRRINLEAPATPAPGVMGSVMTTLLPLLLPLIPALLAALTAWLNRQAQPQTKAQPEYMAEPWFLILQAVCMEYPRVDVARSLGVSAPFLSQVLNGSGKYGRGEASTHRLAERVLRKFASLNARPAHHKQQPLPLVRKTTVTVEH